MEVRAMSPTKTLQAKRLLEAQLEAAVARSQAEATVPEAGAVGDDFFDVAQGVEHQEFARLSASRLAQRVRRLQRALARVEDGQYGTCSECEAPIPPKRLLAVPDATTCVACQERLERVSAA
jgi:DnaK suppressor protein